MRDLWYVGFAMYFQFAWLYIGVGPRSLSMGDGTKIVNLGLHRHFQLKPTIRKSHI